MHALKCLVKVDDYERAQGAYVADCLGMIARQMYQNNDFPLFTQLTSEPQKKETVAEVKGKILRMLGA